MKKKHTFLVAPFLVLLSMGSCTEDLNDRSAGIISASQNGYTSIDVYDFGINPVIDLSVAKGGLQDVNATVTFTVDETLLDSMKRVSPSAYANCELLPQSCYDLKDATFNVETGGDRWRSGGKLTYYPDKIIAQSGGLFKFVLPLRVTVEGVSLNANRSTVIYGFVPQRPVISLTEETMETMITPEALQLNIGTNFPTDLWNLTVKVGEKNTAAFVEEYNAEHATNYQVLDEGVYTLPQTIEMGKGVTAKSFSITFARENIAVGKYCLPLYITRLTGQGEASIEISDRPVVLLLERDDKVNREGWTIVANSEEETGESGGANGRAIHLIDGLTSTFWHSHWSQPQGEVAAPYELVIDMQKEVNIRRIGLISRQASGTARFDIKFYAGNTYNVDWTNLASWGEPIGEAVEFDSNTKTEQIFDVTDVSARYLRMSIPENKYGATVAYMAELYVHDANDIPENN